MENQEKTENLQQEKKVSSNVIEFEKKQLTEDIQKAANWFYWIAGLSIANSLVFYFSKDLYFVVGLGITQFIEGVLSELKNGPSLIALILNLMIAGFFIFFGYMSRKYKKWAFIIGVIIYIIDALIYLYTREWMAVGFHIFAIVMISKGFIKVFEYDKVCKQEIQ